MHRISLVLLMIAGAVAADAQMVVTRSSAASILIPAAGSVPGGNGTYFRSDLTLLNYRSSDQRVQIQWLPQNVPGRTVAPVVLTITALSGLHAEAFVASILHQTGLGAIVITGVTASGAADPNAQLVATSRIWSPQPNAASGPNSQQFTGIPIADINSSTLSI